MRELNECKAEIFRRIEKGIKERKIKRNRILACCIPLCICAAILGVGILQGDFFTKKPNIAAGNNLATQSSSAPADGIESVPQNGNLSGVEAPNDTTTQSGQDNSTNDASSFVIGSEHIPGNPVGTEKLDCDNIVSDVKFNKILGSTAITEPYFDPELYYSEALDYESRIDYLGIDYTRINPEVIYTNNYANLITDRSGNIVFDTFSTTDGYHITILSSRVGPPFDLEFTLETYEESTFYYTDDQTHAPVTAIIGTDYIDFYFADFSVGGVNYRIISENLDSSDELCYVIKAIICLSTE